MRADFLRLYGLELEDVPIDGMAEMIAAMPRGTRTLAIMCPAAEWTDAEYLLANVVDGINGLMYGLSGGKGSKPKPVARPGGKPGVRKKHATMRADELLERLNEMR